MYDDIINMPRPVSERYAPMSLYDRAAQFAPFSALTGLDEELAAVEQQLLIEPEKDFTDIDLP